MVSQNFEYCLSDLSPQSLEVFYYLSHGFSPVLISEIMEIDVRDVYEAFEFVQSYLSALTLHHAVAILISSGLISVSSTSFSCLRKLYLYLSSSCCDSSACNESSFDASTYRYVSDGK